MIQVKRMYNELKAIFSNPISISIFLFLLGTFSLGSLISYNPYDRSFFHLTTQDISLTNWFGWFGAQWSSLLLFFLGGFSSYVFALFILFFAYESLKSEIYTYTKEQIGAFFSLILLNAMVAYHYQTDFFCNNLPAGGLLGYLGSTLISYCFDAQLQTIFLWVLMLSCCIIASRLSFVRWAPFLVSYDFLYWCNAIIIAPVMEVVRCIIKIVKKLTQTTQLILDEEEPIKNSLLEVEYEFDAQTFDKDLDFWQQFNTEKKDVQHNQEENESTISLEKLSKPINPEPKIMQTPIIKRISYELPNVNWFAKNEQDESQETMESHKQLSLILEEKLERFGIKGKVINIKVGPVITLFEYQPDIDSKISKIIALEDDLALALQAMSIRIIAPIPGRSVVGFEVSNKQRRTVQLGSILQSHNFKKFGGHLPLVIGEDSIGNTVIVDLATMPHLLVAGSTGSGKSVALNTMLVSLLCKHTPQTVRLILIDPKRLEFASYGDIPHLLVPIVTDPKRAALVLKWVVKTMEERYEIMEHCNVRNIFDYHAHMNDDPDKKPMPFIVIMIDELSDLMMTAPKETEDLIARITQMARAAGIHMVVATQRPSVDVITGLIKVNFPSRISFRVTSKIDSRTILDCNGADKLLGKGDMLFLDSSSRLIRAHAAYVSDKEIEKVVAHIRTQQAAQYVDLNPDIIITHDDDDIDDTLYQDVLRFLDSTPEVSISSLQRRFRIGYNRSARIIHKLESQGLIMQEPGSKTRKVIR